MIERVLGQESWNGVSDTNFLVALSVPGPSLGLNIHVCLVRGGLAGSDILWHPGIAGFTLRELGFYSGSATLLGMSSSQRTYFHFKIRNNNHLRHFT